MPYIFRHIAAMPDAHVGMGAAIGSVFAAGNVVVPSAVGVDIGCGMRAVQTDIPVASLTRKTLLRFIDRVYHQVPAGFKSHGSAQAWKGFDSFPLKDKDLRHKAACQLGTLGGGNHFIELQSDGRFLWLMIHTGSRHIGLRIADHFIEIARSETLKKDPSIPPDLCYLELSSQSGRAYLDAMNWALRYARENRDRLFTSLSRILETTVHPGFGMTEAVEIHHNFAALETHFGHKVMVHRKGATRAFKNETGIIPGSMGTPSYIVRGKGNTESFMSCSHGAGRVLGRRQARKKLSMQDLKQSMRGIAAHLKPSMLDEAPQAYKNIDRVMAAQQDLVDIVYRLTPLAGVKG